jgi:hypothetical protein
MMSHTRFASLDDFRKGEIELISGSRKEYAFSNLFEVASASRPWDRTAVARNLEYVQEVVRAEGTSPWFACAHDEFVICMDGEVVVEYVQLKQPRSVVAGDRCGAVRVPGEPDGCRMGVVWLRRGHQALLNRDCAYRFLVRDSRPGVLLLQTMLGDLTVQKWAEICLN